MVETKAIVPAAPMTRQVSLDTLKMAESLASITGLYGMTELQRKVAMLIGWELGFGMLSSLNLIHVIQVGSAMRPALSTLGMNALIQRSAALKVFEVEDLVDQNSEPVGCRVKMVRKDSGLAYETTFTKRDAERAELLAKPNWVHWPGDMYRSRAIAKCGRVVCPAEITRLYLADELGAVTDRDGVPLDNSAVIEGQVRVVKATPVADIPLQPVAPPPSPKAKIPTLMDLAETYGHAAVWEACGGMMPGNDPDELRKLAEKLEQGE